MVLLEKPLSAELSTNSVFVTTVYVSIECSTDSVVWGSSKKPIAYHKQYFRRSKVPQLEFCEEKQEK